MSEYRAYDTTTEWMGSTRTSLRAAEKDAKSHNGCAKQGGYGSAIVVTRDPESENRCVDLEGDPVWPPHGRSNGSVRWRNDAAQALGRKGGAATSEAKTTAVRANGAKGGRPRLT